MLQTGPLLSFISFVLILVGLILLVKGISQRPQRSTNNGEQDRKSESRGVILIGPVPIVWGFGNRGRLIMVFLFAFMMVVWLLLFL